MNAIGRTGASLLLMIQPASPLGLAPDARLLCQPPTVARQ